MPEHRRRRLPLAVASLLLAAAATGPGGTGIQTAQAATAAAFSVGAAVQSYTPYCGPDGTPALNGCALPPAGFIDPADCGGAADATVYTGRRLFAFEEPYVDQQGDGHYDLGDPYLDCNGDGRWDGNFIGGGGNAPRFYDHVADPVTARAMVVGNGTRTIAIEVLDNEGAFNTYLAAIRSRVAQMLPAGASLSAAGIFISSTHDESAPDTIGLYGVNATTSSANPYLIAFMETQAARAIVDAVAATRPATIRYGEAIEPASFRQCFSSYPFVDDQIVPTLQAVAGDGSVIATLGDVSQHAETLGFNGGSALDPGAPVATTLEQEKTWLSADWPYWFRHSLEAQFGGVAIEMAGSVGSNETPQVFPQPVSRTPQQFVDASHPAGCRTEFLANQSTMVPLGYYSEDVALGNQLAAAVSSALASGTVSSSNAIAGARSNICILVTNALFDVAGLAGVFGERPGFSDPGCTVPAPVPPTGNVTATYIQSQVAAFQIGDGTFVSIPGEVFPFTFLRSFLGPADVPCPDPNPNGACGGAPSPALSCASGNPYALPPWLMPHMHTPYRFIDGLGEDMIGYIFPCGNGVGVPGEYPVSNPGANSTDRFGCGHSDDSESASSDAANIIGAAAVPLLDNLGGGTTGPEDIEQGRYVLGDGTLSRDPLGGPSSIGCSVNTTFAASGPATAVELADGTVVTPASWMSLSGRPQAAPDRNTRGYIDASGTRHWLDVFADLAPPAQAPEAPWVPLLVVAAAAALAGRRGWRRRTGSSAHPG
ncbi:MAG: hypothetical protein ACYDAC_07135 [Candidatus Dormibacteria bacterium]